MKTIRVDLGERSYPIWIEKGLSTNLSQLLSSMNRGQKWVVFTQSSIADRYCHVMVENMNKTGFDTTSLTIPTGEKAKTLIQVEKIYDQLVKLECDRSTTLIALGGGVVGDITGFVAATYMRGLDYLQIPTTLLAMVDSAIGGKTGINLPEGKNLVGAFYQPKGVIIDPDLLRSLPKREVISAMAEIFKYGAIKDRDFFIELNDKFSLLMDLDDDLILHAISRSCEIKADIVSRDEQEEDLRRILNFGHTVGHALETTLGYGVLKHGEAIAYGMIAAGQISYKLGYLNRNDRDILESAIRKLPLPELPDLEPAELLASIKHDKKVRVGRLHFVVLNGLGNAVISDKVDANHIRKGLEAIT